jgi:hypothetical protein
MQVKTMQSVPSRPKKVVIRFRSNCDLQEDGKLDRHRRNGVLGDHSGGNAEEGKKIGLKDAFDLKVGAGDRG